MKCPMPNIRLKIENDFRTGLKNKDDLLVSVLRLLKTAIINEEKKKKSTAVSDEEIIKIIFSEIKKRKEAILLFEKGHRKNLAEKEKKEITILQKYLPEQISEQEIKKMAVQTIKKIKAESISDMGKVMKELMLKLKGRAEPAIISQIVKELLS